MAETTIELNSKYITISDSDVEEGFRKTEAEFKEYEFNYKPWHFIEIDSTRKPVKPVFLNIEPVSEVIDSVSDFNTLDALEVFDELGFNLFSKKENAEKLLIETFEEILENYSDITEDFSGEHRIYKLLKSRTPNLIKYIVDKKFDKNKFDFQGSPGQGNWAKVPWIAILHKEETETVREGFYPVFLINPEEKKFYLTLNQGVTELESKEGRIKAKDVLRERRENLRYKINLESFSKEKPELPGDKGEMYSIGSIFQKEYSLEKMPTPEELKKDIYELLEKYEHFVEDFEELGKDVTGLAKEYRSELNLDTKKIENEIERFRNKYPEESISSLDIDEWAPKEDNPNSENTVYYWLEHIIDEDLGSFFPGGKGAEVYKIRYVEDELVDLYQNNAAKTFEKMKDNVVKSLDLLDKSNYSEIDDLEPLPRGDVMIRWLMFYRPKKIIPIFSKSKMKDILQELGLEVPEGYFSRNKKLLDYKNSYEEFSDWSNFEFMHFITDYEEGNLDDKKEESSEMKQPDQGFEVSKTIDVSEDIKNIASPDLNDLYFPNKNEILSQIKAAIKSGKHIIFTGPPGTGKTELAEKVAEKLQEDENVTGYHLTTATSDWSTFDTVGGYRPTGKEKQLEFNPGHILKRFKQNEDQKNEVLVIDEINRANIDKAFGQLFTVLSGQRVRLPFTKNDEEVEIIPGEDFNDNYSSNKFVVPKSWRILATMNTYDKTSLYEMSYAFMRRFSFIRVDAPEIPEENKKEFLDDYLEVWGMKDGGELVEGITDEILGAIGEIWYCVNNAVEGREIGPAIVKDMLEFTKEYSFEGNEDGEEELENALTAAVTNFVFPQLEGVPKRKEIVKSILEGDVGLNEERLKNVAKSMLNVEDFSGED